MSTEESFEPYGGRGCWDHEIKKAEFGYEIVPVGGGIVTKRWTLAGAKREARRRQRIKLRAERAHDLLQQPPVWTTAEDRRV